MDLTKDSSKEHINKIILDAQLYIQNNLDADLSLQAIAKQVALSTSYFHRHFKAKLGETVKAYVNRLRIEKSLYDIHVQDTNLTQIAWRYGFKNPETFSRVFKQVMKHSPSYFLKRHKEYRQAKTDKSLPIDQGLRKSENKSVCITRLQELQLAFIRHIGPYEQVPMISSPGDHSWRQLEHYVVENKLTKKPFQYIGIAQDSPNNTAPKKLRFDCCLLVNQIGQPKGEIAFQSISSGYYAVITHAGPYAMLSDSYVKLFETANQLKDFTITSAPPFELLIDIDAKTLDDHTWTEIYLPLQAK